MQSYRRMARERVAGLVLVAAAVWDQAKARDSDRAKAAAPVEASSTWVAVFLRRGRFMRLSRNSPKRRARPSIREFAHWASSSEPTGAQVIFASSAAWAWASTRKRSKR